MQMRHPIHRGIRCSLKKAWIDPGPVIKRFQPKDRGKAYPIKKRTAHLVVVVGERGEDEKKYVHKNPVGGRPGKATQTSVTQVN